MIDYVSVKGGIFTKKEPDQEVTIEDFHLGKCPVTNKEYLGFVQATAHRNPAFWKNSHYNNGNQPVVGVNWEDAVAYCDWLAKNNNDGVAYRLPIEAEWEWAAGGGKRQYPWGNEPPDHNRANYDDKVGYPTPVGSYPAGATPNGLLDMAGNVWEWCADWYDKEKEYRVLRGGLFLDVPVNLQCSIRYRNYPQARDLDVGFRVAYRRQK